MIRGKGFSFNPTTKRVRVAVIVRVEYDLEADLSQCGDIDPGELAEALGLDDPDERADAVRDLLDEHDVTEYLLRESTGLLPGDVALGHGLARSYKLDDVSGCPDPD